MATTYTFTWRTGLDAVLFVLFAWGLSQRSRVAAVALCGYLVLTKFALWIQFNKIGSLIGLFVLGYFFFQGARATFAARRNRLAIDTIVPPAS